MGMSPLQATYEDDNGDEKQIDAHDIVNMLKAKGVPVTGYSPDGGTILGQTPDGQPLQMPLDQAMAKLGRTATSMKPHDDAIDDSNVNIGYRLGIKYLENDEDKKDYLRTKLAKEGAPNANIVGSGNSFYSFDPQKGMYRALTSGKGIGMEDVVDHGIDLATGPVAGAAMGLATGGPIGGVMGAMGESAVGDTLARGGEALLDSDAADHMDLGHQAEEVGMNALRAGAVGAATGAIGKKFKGMMAGPMAEEDAGNFLNSSSVDKRQSIR